MINNYYNWNCRDLNNNYNKMLQYKPKLVVKC